MYPYAVLMMLFFYFWWWSPYKKLSFLMFFKLNFQFALFCSAFSVFFVVFGLTWAECFDQSKHVEPMVFWSRMFFKYTEKQINEYFFSNKFWVFCDILLLLLFHESRSIFQNNLILSYFLTQINSPATLCLIKLCSQLKEETSKKLNKTKKLMEHDNGGKQH